MSFFDLFKPAARRKKLTTTVAVDGLAVPTSVFFEPRNNYRFSIQKNGLIVRMPLRLAQKEVEELMEKASAFVAASIQKKPAIRGYFESKSYETGQILTVGKRQYRLEVEKTDLETHSATLSKGVIFLKLSRKTASPAALEKSTKTLLSRVVGKDFLPEMKRRVNEINHLHFRKEIERISLKYNASNWGSCSTGRNLNFSTRLLFAPDDVIDYIIVHELAHLVEMNHSARFWAVVERAMPDYLEKEKWLKTHGGSCDF